MPSIHEAIELLKLASIAQPRACPAPTAEELARAESYLGAPLPPSFKIFLAEAGFYKLRYWETFWVGDDSLGYRNIIEANRTEREDAEPAALRSPTNSARGSRRPETEAVTQLRCETSLSCGGLSAEGCIAVDVQTLDASIFPRRMSAAEKRKFSSCWSVTLVLRILGRAKLHQTDCRWPRKLTAMLTMMTRERWVSDSR